MRRLILLIILPLLALCVFTGLVRSSPGGTIQQTDLAEKRVYAYRDWQSVGVILHGGDRFTIKAEGEWLYTPVGGYNGPEGHKTYWSPDFTRCRAAHAAAASLDASAKAGSLFTWADAMCLRLSPTVPSTCASTTTSSATTRAL